MRLILLLFATLVFAQEISNTHEVGTDLYDEHDALFALFPLNSATHVAATSGSWFSTSTWEQGEIPTSGSRVHIPPGVTVLYDSQADTRIFVILVQGTLEFSSSSSSRLVVDTLIGDPDSTITIGTKAKPIPAEVEVDIVIANNGNIDVSWDTNLLSRGLVTHGNFEAHGAKKTEYLKVSVDPMAGDTTLELSELPEGWSVGDLLVLAGTHYDGYKWDNSERRTRHHLPEDEVVTITAISGTTLTIDTALVHDHDSPRADLKTYVANMNRNIKVRSEDGASTPVHQRGHVMFMHNPSADVRYVEFYELGRTDKSYLATDVSRWGTITSTANVKGRYSMHFHRNGVPENRDQRNPAIAIGNVVNGSPGWGFVHHDSNAMFARNVAYNCFGAGFSSETGNEVGAWIENLAIYAKGIAWGNPKGFVDLDEFDTGNTGDCFWFQSRMVKAVGNIAASCDSGFVYFHRGKLSSSPGQLRFDALANEFPQALGYREAINPGDSPIRSFADNEAFACNFGVFVVKANPHQNHDVHSHFERMTAWSVRWGAHIEYSAHYILEDFDIVGRVNGPFTGAVEGIHIGNNAGDISIRNAKISDFPVGIDFLSPSGDPLYRDRNLVILDCEYINVDEETGGVTSYDTILTAADTSDEFSIEITSPLTFSGLSTERRVVISGTKTDGLGTSALPPPGDFGPDDFTAQWAEVITLLERYGYYHEASSPDVKLFVLPDYYTDRLTGEIHKFGSIVTISSGVVPLLGSSSNVYANAIDMGEISLPNGAPTTTDEFATTTMDTDVTIDLLSNDFDSDGDEVFVDGIQQPKHGDVFTNGDGTVLYRPFFGYLGPDSFKYWVSDRHGNFEPAYVTIEVLDATAPPSPVGSSGSSASTESSEGSDSAGGSSASMASSDGSNSSDPSTSDSSDPSTSDSSDPSTSDSSVPSTSDSSDPSASMVTGSESVIDGSQPGINESETEMSAAGELMGSFLAILVLFF